MSSDQRKPYKLIVAIALLAIAAVIYFTTGYDRDSEVPSDTLSGLEGKTKEFICDACGEKKSLPALEFMAQTSSVALMGKVICKPCQDAGKLSDAGPAQREPN